MSKYILIIMISLSSFNFGQNEIFNKLDFIIGSWIGEGSVFGNNNSNITSDFILIMNNKYIEIINDSRFSPTDKNPNGEHHIDKGFVSFDETRHKIVYRQFNIEGYVNQYLLVDSLSNDSTLIFETEYIENFLPGGKAKWTIRKVDDNNIETIFDVSFPDKEYACFGINKLRRKE